MKSIESTVRATDKVFWTMLGLAVVSTTMAYFAGLNSADKDDLIEPSISVEARQVGEENLFVYAAEVIRVVDGDTIDCRVDLGFDVGINARFRLAGINAPELKTLEGKAAKQRVEELCPVGSVLIVDTIKDRKEKYGRYLGFFTTSEGLQVNQVLLDEGHAVRYP